MFSVHALVSEVDLALSIKCYVLKKSVSLDRIVDVRLRLFVKVDNLSVASTLEVEYSVVIPAVLVITDEKTFRVGRKGSLAGSGKSEEDSGVLAVQVGVGRAVAWTPCPSAAGSSSSWRTYPSSSRRRTMY